MDFRTLSAIGFLYEYNPDPLLGRVLNSASIPIRSIITNVQEDLTSPTMSLYPQPANDIVTFQFEISTRNNRIEIFSVLGDMVYAEDILHSGNGQYIGRIDVSAFPAGVYTIRLKTDEQVHSQAMRVMR